MSTVLLSHCCKAEIQRDGFGHVLCGACWNATIPTPSHRDLIGWLFPTETAKRPKGEPVFVRYGKRIELLRPEQVRGHPDGWCWSDA